MKLRKINAHFHPDIDPVEINQMFLYLRGDINHETTGPIIAEIISANMDEDCECENPEEKCECDEKPDIINLLICSGGGDLAATMSLISVMEGSEIPIRTIALGECGSGAFMIFISGDERVITPYTALLSHQFSAGTESNYSGLEAAMVEMKKSHERMITLYQNKTGLDRKKIERKLLNSTDTWLSPEECVDYNLADLICDLK